MATASERLFGGVLLCVMSVAGSGSNGRACQWNKCWSGSNFSSGSLMLGNASNQ